MKSENYDPLSVDPSKSVPGLEINKFGHAVHIYCMDCLTEDYAQTDFMVRNDLWWKAFGKIMPSESTLKPRGILCISCLKKRLELQHFSPNDFPLLAVNVLAFSIIQSHFKPNYTTMQRNKERA